LYKPEGCLTICFLDKNNIPTFFNQNIHSFEISKSEKEKRKKKKKASGWILSEFFVAGKVLPKRKIKIKIRIIEKEVVVEFSICKEQGKKRKRE